METFRFSKEYLRRQFASFWISIAVVAAVVAYQYMKERSNPATFLVVAIAVLVAAVLYFRRIYKRTVEHASGHSLVLTVDAIVLRDGPIEQRIPYTSIEKMRIRKALTGYSWFSLQISGLGTDRFYGYEKMEQLIATVASKLSRDHVSGRVSSA